MIRDKKAYARRDALEASHANPNANGPDKKHHTLHAGPVNRIRIARDQGVDEQRRPDNQDVKRQEDTNEKSPQHRQATFSNPAPLVKRNVESTASLTNGDRAGLAAKHPLSNVARPFAGVRIFDNLVESLLDFAEPEFERQLLVFPANLQLQRIACLLFLQPAIHPPGRLSAVPF